MGAGAQISIYMKILSYEYLPLRTDGCEEQGYSSYWNSTNFIGYQQFIIVIHTLIIFKHFISEIVIQQFISTIKVLKTT